MRKICLTFIILVLSIASFGSTTLTNAPLSWGSTATNPSLSVPATSGTTNLTIRHEGLASSNRGLKGRIGFSYVGDDYYISAITVYYYKNSGTGNGDDKYLTTYTGTAAGTGYGTTVLNSPTTNGYQVRFAGYDRATNHTDLSFASGTKDVTIYIGNSSIAASSSNSYSIVYYSVTLTASSGGGCTATANAGADKVTTANSGVALAATAAGTGKTGTWSITSKPDGSSASASSFSSVNSATATFTPDKVGNYTLTWTVECDEDDTETASDNMTVTTNCIAISPSLSYASVGGTTLDVGDSSSGSPTVSGNTGSGSVSYAVTTASPAGCLTVNASTGVASAIAAGSATVTATIVASGNYCGNTATANFTIADDCTDPGLTITLN